ncbi:esterase 5-like protein [Leptotrombidium deliense]|uniref:Esterase 5-like protein n=1 Tax=Leptotrombidium deliense TaxID=299467 RepID=A0A443SI22_9ACAR|nr:esterase 5-like protein [Leptotrombidium deliense]
MLKEGKTKEEIMNILRHFLDKLVPSELAIDTEDVIKLYFSPINDEDVFKAKIAFLTALSDAFYICPSIILANKYSKVSPVYQYVFAYNSNHSLVHCNTFGPCHANDVPFVFGTIEKENDREANVEWMKIIGEFVKNGRTHWSPYYIAHSNVLIPVYYAFRENELQKSPVF